MVCSYFSMLQSSSDKTSITKELIATAIEKSLPESPQLKFLHSSPLCTPNKSGINFVTPQKMSNEKLQEYKRLKIEIDNLKDDRNSLESEIKDKDDRIDSLGK